MDIVYICRAGDNEELRYSLRSLQNLPHANVWLVGEKPAWYKGNFIKHPNKRASKFDNIRSCFDAILATPEISNSFILMNDDFFIVEPMQKMTVWNGGSLEKKLKLHQSLSPASAYTKLIQTTYDELLRLGIEDPIDYDIHVPMIMDKEGIKKVSNRKNLIQSMYGNLNNVGGSETVDVKVYLRNDVLFKKSFDFENKSSAIISTHDGSFDAVYNKILKDMFPNPSQYE